MPSSKCNADRKRKFFQRRGASAPNSSSFDQLDSSPHIPTRPIHQSNTSSPKTQRNYNLQKENSDSAVSRALEEALRTTSILGYVQQKESNLSSAKVEMAASTSSLTTRSRNLFILWLN